MKRITAASKIKGYLGHYRERVEKDKAVLLLSYSVRACPLCIASKAKGSVSCGDCLRWPGQRGDNCFGFMSHVNCLKTVRGKLNWIDKLEAEIDRWASEEKS